MSIREVGGEEIYWIVTCTVSPEQMTEFKKIVGQLIAAAKNEAGTLAYEFSIDADQSIVHIFERYRNSDAIVSHVTQTFGPFAERFLAAAQVRGFVVYGTPSTEVREVLAGFKPTYMTPFNGFTR
jgi:quinol monooxygenase YgiN